MTSPAELRRSLFRCALLVAAGVLFGWGTLLLGQVRVARLMRAEVSSTFFLLRGIGYATFFLQPNENRIALALSGLDEAYLVHSERVGLTLVVVGGLFLFSVPFVGRRRRRRTARRRT